MAKTKTCFLHCVVYGRVNYKDVVCERLRKRLRFTPADDTTDDLSSGDDEDNDVTVQLLVIVI